MNPRVAPRDINE